MNTARAALIAAAGVLAIAGPAGAIVDSADAPSETAEDYGAAGDFQAGVKAYDAGDYAAAAEIFAAQASATDYGDPVPLTWLGMARAASGDLLRAGLALNSAIDADAGYLPAYEELAVVKAQNGDIDAAEFTLEQLQEKSTACGADCTNVEDLDASVARIRAAIDGEDTAMAAPPRLIFAAGDSAYLDAVGLINEARYEEALDSLKAARQAFGPHPDVLTYLGFVNRKLGRYEEAEAYYQRALAAAPAHRGAMEYYGELKVVRGDMAGARALLAALEADCAYGCAEADELRGWIDGEHGSEG